MPHRMFCFLFAATAPAWFCFADPPQAAAVQTGPAPVQQQGEDAGPLTREKPAQAADQTEAEDASGDAGDSDEAQGEDKPSEEELRKRMAELEKELKQTRDKFQERAQEDRRKQEEEQRKKVEQISLPENPTREQCEAFIEELREAAKNKRSYSSNDPIVDKLKSLPEEHFDLLMVEMTNNSPLRYFANYAMRGIEPEKLRERFVSSLDQNPNNIGIIVMNGWTQDVRDQVIRKVQSADANLSPAWFQAAVEIADPKLYPKLHEITIGSRYASQFLNILQALPDYDLAHTVNVCWKRAGEDKIPVNQASFAMLAAEQGNVDALRVLVDQLNTVNSYYANSTTYNARRTNVLRFIDYRGSNQEIRAWFEKNQDKLTFDNLQKRYVLPDTD